MIRKPNSISDVAAALRACQSTLVVSHYNPDADALGSSLGLALALEQSGMRVAIVNESPVPERYRFLAGSGRILNQLPEGQWDAVVMLDCGEFKRAGDILAPQLKAFPALINIDHHYTNDLFGSCNLLDPSASSTSEIVWMVLEEMKISISRDVAECLLAGIFGDTGSFRYASTTERTFSAAQALLRAGARPDAVANRVYGSKPLRQVSLEAAALSQLRLHKEGKVAEVLITEEMYSRCAAGPEDTEQIVELARDIAGVEIAVLIRADGELWKVSLRVKGAGHNVAEIASRFGGGGHKAAAAFRWRRSLEELRTELMAAVSAEVDRK